MSYRNPFWYTGHIANMMAASPYVTPDAVEVVRGIGAAGGALKRQLCSQSEQLVGETTQ